VKKLVRRFAYITKIKFKYSLAGTDDFPAKNRKESYFLKGSNVQKAENFFS
jgi:hypothetical protein